MRILWRVVVKELLQLRQDRRMIPVLLVGPMIQLIIFGFAVNTDVTHVPMVLVDLDRSAASRQLVDSFLGGGYFELVGAEDSTRPVESWLRSGRAQMALVVAAGYGREAARGGRPQVQVIADGSDASPATVALGYASAILSRESERLIRRQIESLSAAPPGRIELVPRVWYNPDLRSRWFYVPAVLAMILMIMTMILSAMAVVREKEIGTLEQIMVTPIRPWQLLVGLPFGVIGIGQVFLVSGIAVWGFGVPLRGSLALLVLLTQLFLLTTLGLGLLISTVVRNQQQAMMLAAFGFMLPMVYLSGLIFPIENMPPVIQYITYLIPLRYYATIIRGIFLKGSGLDVLWPEAMILLGFGTTILTVASLRFRKRLD